MLSITDTIRSINKTQRRMNAWCSRYTGLLRTLENSVVELCGDGTSSIRENIAATRNRLAPDSEADLIEAQGAKAEQAVQALARELGEARAMREKEFKKIIWITAEAGAAMVRSGKSHADEITQFAARVEATSCLESVVEIRCQMAQRLNELNSVARRIQDDSERNAASLSREIQKIQERLKAAESLAETDELTKLGNRRLLERKIATEIEEQNRFSIVVLDLNGFKAVNDRFGHAQGDRLLQAVAGALSRCVRTTDSVGRWGGDEFVIVLHGTSLAEAEARVSQIQGKAFGEFILGETGKGIKVEISACFGIAECQPGESADQLFDRADRQLYELKQSLHNSKKSRVAPRMSDLVELR